MSSVADQNGPSRTRKHLSDERQFRVLVALTFPVFLVLVLIGSLIGKRTAVPGTQARQSILSEAHTAASTTIALAFSG